MLVARDEVTTNSGKAQQKLGKLVNRGWHAVHTASLDQLPETARPPGPYDPLGGGKPRPSPRLEEGQEPPHAFGHSQRTRSVSYPRQNSCELEGTSWGLMNTWK